MNSNCDPGQPCVKMTWVTRPDVDELDIDPINRGNEFRQGIQLLLGLTPIILASPVANQFLDTLELDALGDIADSLLIRPTRVRDPLAKIVELRLRDMNFKRANAFIRLLVLGTD